MAAKAIMIQGTTSNAGKSMLAAGLCRWLKAQNKRVAPFKPQNMSLNSAVTVDGGEIGRAQAMQAVAAGVLPVTDMNPILLKPNSTTGSQIIVNGKPIGNMSAAEYHRRKPEMMQYVLEAFARLQARYDFVIVEGAGSPAEINLREGDIANMGFAERVDCPVLLISDIEQGGVFAHLYGTLALLSQSERRRVAGLVINKFRGDVSLLQPGIDWLGAKTRKAVLGVLPYIPDLLLEAEDSLSSRARLATTTSESSRLKVSVVRTPRVSNDTDFDALFEHPQVQLTFVNVDETLPPTDLVILPGSKNVRDDLHALNRHHWRDKLLRHLRYGGKILGICGGFQMLGKTIADPHGLESDSGSSAGFNLLDLDTVLKKEKQLARVSGRISFDRAPVTGYEIHMGTSHGAALQQPLILFDNQTTDGAVSSDGQVAGTYVHGLFDSPSACSSLLQWAGLASPQLVDMNQIYEQRLDKLAQVLNDNLQMKVVETLLGM